MSKTDPVESGSAGDLQKKAIKKNRRGYQKFVGNFCFPMDFSKLLENLYDQVDAKCTSISDLIIRTPLK